MDYQKLLQQAVDLHAHVGPEIIPRKFGVLELAEYETGKLWAIGVKNHFFPTVSMRDPSVKNEDVKIIHSVTLNRYVGGFNADVVRASAELSRDPIIVWFPTIHAQNFLRQQEWEVAKEWIDPKFDVSLRRADSIQYLTVLDEQGNIKKAVRGVLEAIKEYGAILATGHISWQESLVLVRFAIKVIGLKKVIITHPIYQKIAMPMAVQKELAKLGAKLEHCYSMYSIDKIPISEITNQIKAVGALNCILSSDVGQAFSPSPSEALLEFMRLLVAEGVSEKELEIMLVNNPNNLIAQS